MPAARTPVEPGLAAHAVVTREAMLYLSRRGEHVLVVEPRSASWGVFSQPSWRLLGGADRPTSVDALVRAASAGGVAPSDARALLARMYQQGFIRVDGRPFHDTRAMWERPPELPSFVSIHVAQGCNLRCSYCYADAGAELDRMPIATMHAAVGKAIRELPGPSLTIDFLGGEPFLLFDDIVEVIRAGRQVADDCGKAVAWIMQTNGTLLSRERARLLTDLGVGVGVSLDGPRHLHDRYRPRAGGSGSFDEVFANLLAAREIGLRVSPLAVVHEPHTYREILEFFVGHGFHHVRFNYTSRLGRARDMLEFPPDRAESFARGFLDMVEWAHDWCLREKKLLQINDLNQMIAVLLTRNRDYMCMRSSCGAGDAILSFGTKGEIYACEEFERNTKSTFLLGQLGARTLPDVVRESPNYALLKQRRVENIPRCSRCHLRHFCGGGCTHKALAYYGTTMREDPMCRYYQVVFEELMWKIWRDRRLAENLGVT